MLVAGCGSSSGPKNYSLVGNWVGSGSTVNGVLVTVTQVEGDTVLACLGDSSASAPMYATETQGQVVFYYVYDTYQFGATGPAFVGHFVNDDRIDGTIEGVGSPATAMFTRTGTATAPCTFP